MPDTKWKLVLSALPPYCNDNLEKCKVALVRMKPFSTTLQVKQAPY